MSSGMWNDEPLGREFWEHLTRVDLARAEKVRAEGCRECGGPLDRVRLSAQATWGAGRGGGALREAGELLLPPRRMPSSGDAAVGAISWAQGVRGRAGDRSERGGSRVGGAESASWPAEKSASSVPPTTNSGRTVSRYLPSHARARSPTGTTPSRSPLPRRTWTVPRSPSTSYTSRFTSSLRRMPVAKSTSRMARSRSPMGRARRAPASPSRPRRR